MHECNHDTPYASNHCAYCVGEQETKEINRRAMELAELVSGMVWGGEHGWERATDEQFESLKKNARRLIRRGIEATMVEALEAKNLAGEIEKGLQSPTSTRKVEDIWNDVEERLKG